jgi:PAS domain S-box-containing protein
MSDGFAIFDSEWQLLAWNTAFARMFAYPHIVMAPGLDFAQACREAGVADATGRNRPAGERAEFATADNRIVQALHRETAEGGHVSVYRDVTALIETQRALAEAERDHASLFENAAIGIYRSLPDGRQLRANAALVRINGYSSEAEMLASVRDIAREWYVDPDRRQEFRRRLERDGFVINMESEIHRHKTRERIWISETAWLVRDAAGRVKYYEGTVEEITTRKQAEAALRMAKEAAETASRAKSDFLANMSHELRTPLNAILGFSEVIRDRVFGDNAVQRYASYAANIHASGSHLLAVINDILDMAKIEAGRLDMREEVVAPLAEIATCLTLIEPRALAGRIELVKTLPAQLPNLFADAKQFRQILLNILSNAVKFTPPGGRVTVEAELTPGMSLAIRIRDTGIGIAPAEMPRLFEPFRQGDASRTQGHEGTGLGLTITRRLLEQHGGRIAIDSKLGAGTAVSLEFPTFRLLLEDGLETAVNMS